MFAVAPGSTSAPVESRIAGAALASATGQCVRAAVGRAGAPTGDADGRTLERRGRVRVAGQDADELVARADLELGEDLAQVIFDGARADEQTGADLWVRESVAGQPRDLGFLRGQL